MKIKSHQKRKFCYIENPQNMSEISSPNIGDYSNYVIRYAQQLKYEHESKNTDDKPYLSDDQYLEIAQKYYDINRYKSYVSKMRMAYNPSEPVPNPEWRGYSYTEILNMANNGVYVPKDVLYWAKAQEESDVTAYQVISDEAENDDNSSTQSTNADFDLNNLNINAKENIIKAVKQQEKSENEVDKSSLAIRSFQDLQEKFNDKFSKAEFDQKTDQLKELKNKGEIGELSESESKEFKNLRVELKNSKEDLNDIVKNNEYLEDFMRSIDKIRFSNNESERIADEAIFSALELSKNEEKFSATVNKTHNVNNMRLTRSDDLLNVAGSIPMDFVPQLGIEKGKNLDILVNSVDELLSNTSDIINLNAFDTEIPDKIGNTQTKEDKLNENNNVSENISENNENTTILQNTDETALSLPAEGENISNSVEESIIPSEDNNPETVSKNIENEETAEYSEQDILPEQEDTQEVFEGAITEEPSSEPILEVVPESATEENLPEEYAPENNIQAPSVESTPQQLIKEQEQEPEQITVDDNSEQIPEDTLSRGINNNQKVNENQTSAKLETTTSEKTDENDIALPEKAPEQELNKAESESTKAENTAKELIFKQSAPEVILNDNKNDADISNQRIKTLETYVTKIAEKIESNKTVTASDIKTVSEISAQAPYIAQMSDNLNSDGKKFAYNLASRLTTAEESRSIGEEFVPVEDSPESAPNKAKNTAMQAVGENSRAKTITLTSNNMSKDLEGSLSTINSTAKEIDIKYGNNTDATDEKRETEEDKEEMLEIIDEKNAKADNQLNQIVEVHDIYKPEINATVIASVATYANVKSDSDDDTKAERRLTKFNRDSSLNLRKKNKKVVAVSASTGGSVK